MPHFSTIVEDNKICLVHWEIMVESLFSQTLGHDNSASHAPHDPEDFEESLIQPVSWKNKKYVYDVCIVS